MKYHGVRKHRAPKGALKRHVAEPKEDFGGWSESTKHGSVIRCIKTWREWTLPRSVLSVRKHRAPNGALRPAVVRCHLVMDFGSESAKRQKVH